MRQTAEIYLTANDRRYFQKYNFNMFDIFERCFRIEKSEKNAIKNIKRILSFIHIKMFH